MIKFFKKSARGLAGFYQKQDREFRKFLGEQIKLAETDWDEEFKKYIREKINEAGETERRLRKGGERPPEEVREMEFQRYLKGLDLTIDDLKQKRILDLGCGEGIFVKECLRRGITDQIYGLDLRLNFEGIEKEFRGHFVKANFEEELPLVNLDLIIAVGALQTPSEGIYLRKPQQTIRQALEALKKSGEIRIYPVHQAPSGNGLKGIREASFQWLGLLKELGEQGEIDYQLKPIDIRAAGKKPDIWLEQVLIIRKRQARGR